MRPQELSEGLSLGSLHHEKRDAVFIHRTVVYANQMPMLDTRDRACSANESLHEARGLLCARRRNLECDRTLSFPIDGRVDLTGRAAPQRVLDHVSIGEDIAFPEAYGPVDAT